MLLFSQKTGQLLSVLFDEGYLTAVRTAAAGAVVAKYLAPLELGNVIVRKDLQRMSDEQITVADLTGVAVQDVQISKAVYEALI